MTLQERISADMKEAMKAKDKVRLAALRDIKSKIMLALTETGGADSLDDAAVTKILSKQLKQREDTLAIYKEQGREDLAAEELEQADVIRVYLPQPMTEAEPLRLLSPSLQNWVRPPWPTWAVSWARLLPVSPVAPTARPSVPSSVSTSADPSSIPPFVASSHRGETQLCTPSHFMSQHLM